MNETYTSLKRLVGEPETEKRQKGKQGGLTGVSAKLIKFKDAFFAGKTQKKDNLTGIALRDEQRGRALLIFANANKRLIKRNMACKQKIKFLESKINEKPKSDTPLWVPVVVLTLLVVLCFTFFL